MTPTGSPPRSIEDNYPSYVSETFGYQYDWLELLSLQERTRHDALRAATSEALDAQSAQSALDALAMAHRRAQLGQHQAHLEALRRCLEMPPHPSVAPDEVLEHLALGLATAGAHTRAREVLGARPKWARAEGGRFVLVEGLVARLSGDAPHAKQRFEAYASHERGDEAERCYEIAQLLLEHGLRHGVKGWLERARNEEERAGRGALLVDIELLMARLDEEARPGQ